MGRCARVSNNSSGQWLGLRERLSPETGVPSVLPRLGSTAFSNNVPAKATPVEGQRGGCTRLVAYRPRAATALHAAKRSPSPGSVLMIGSRPRVPKGLPLPAPPRITTPEPVVCRALASSSPMQRSQSPASPRDGVLIVGGASLLRRGKPPAPVATHSVDPGGWLAGYGGRWTDNMLFNARQTQLLRTREPG
eukprot:TRINITY_DN12177_c1_g1_i4.p2 TRINITY_DN12177_c1_g1~~TRINITY_DN12177_c1_g1_i4.p2  ORF type:complete len:192 (+),score=44.62 TRINITY_DN12177_c1_g1_i4:310-885(+)